MRVLVLGSGGMLGHDTVERWRDHDLVTVDYPAVDLTDRASVDAVVAKHAPELIVNCTGYTAVDAAEADEAAALALNGTGVGFLGDAAKRLRATVVHYSTDYVFDGTRAEGYGEGATPNPLSAYGRTKLAGERALAASGCRYYLVRTSWLYGHVGKNFVDTMLRLGRDGDSVSVVDDQHGKPTFTVDLAAATRALVEDRAEPGPYHLVNEGVCTWYDFAVEIFRQARLDVTVEPVPTSRFPRPARRPEWSALVNAKRPPLRPWREALSEYLGA